MAVGPSACVYDLYDQTTQDNKQKLNLSYSHSLFTLLFFITCIISHGLEVKGIGACMAGCGSSPDPVA